MRKSLRRSFQGEGRFRFQSTEHSQSINRTEQEKSEMSSRQPIFKSSITNRQASIPKQGTEIPSQYKVLRELKQKWLIQKVLLRLKRISVLTKKAGSSGVQKQEWEKSGKIMDQVVEEQSVWLLKKNDWGFVCMQIILGIAYALQAWYASIDLVLQVQDNNNPIMFVLILVLLIDFIVNLNTMRIGMGWAAKTRMKIFYYYLRTQSFYDIYLLLYVAIMVIKPSFEIATAAEALAIIALGYKYHIKMQGIRTQLDSIKQIVLVDTFFLLLFVGHINALILYLSTLYRPQDNWLTRIHIANNSWGIKYLYSLYWACTTIVTVGYGDITPTNQCQVFVTILIQLSGSAVFGYLINIIGMTMSELKYSVDLYRKQKQNLNQELSIAQNLIKCFNLKDDLSLKLRSFLKDHSKASNFFSLKDETRIMEKLKPDLRNRKLKINSEIMQQTNIKVIKKCLFFISYFSRGILDIIALKLIKKVFQPNEILCLNNRCIYIINQGKVDLQAYKTHFNKPVYKTLRTISQLAQNNSITSNTYGFTALLLRKNINLSAISKEFTITYELCQQDFQSCMAQYPLDFEAVSELKDVLLNSHVSESIQGPQLVDPKLHYVPVKMLVIRRYNVTSRQPRSPRKSLPVDKAFFNRYEFVQLSQNEGSHTYSAINDKKSNQPFLLYSKGFLPNDDESDNDDYHDWQVDFDQMKQYTKYFTKGNLSNIIEKHCPKIEPVVKRRGGMISKNAPVYFSDP